MKKTRHSETEMVNAVRQLESGVSAELVAREHGISRTSLYKWKSKYSRNGCEPGEALERARGGEPQTEADVRRLGIGQSDTAGRHRKKTVKPEVRKEIAAELTDEYEISIARACCLMEIHRSYFYYESVKDDTEVEEAIRSAAEYGDGFEKIYQRLRHDGYPWNHKKVYRVYKKIHFNKRSRLKKRLPKRVKEPLEAPLEPNKTWSMDFVSDKMENGRTFRVLNILDDSNREAVAQEISMSMPADRVIAIMEKVIFVNGKPECIRTDNGPEFISEKFNIWCQANGIKHKFIQPGKPTQNSYVERFNGSYRRAILDAYIFRNIEEVRELTEKWRKDYNENRPHEALGNMTPLEYKHMLLTGEICSLGHSVPAAAANP